MKATVPLLLLSVAANVGQFLTRPAAIVCPACNASEVAPEPPRHDEPVEEKRSAALHPSPPAIKSVPKLATAAPDLLRSLGAVGPPQERQMRCDIAEQAIRRHWLEDSVNIAADLKKELSDDAWQQRQLDNDLKEYSDALDLTSVQREKFADEYSKIRLDRVASLRDALGEESPDYAAVAASAKEFFGEEDALARTYAGDSGVLRLRADQMEDRTALLSVLLAMADKPWDESVEW